jgi:hypothetical protein
VQAAELDNGDPIYLTRDFLRSFLRHFERQPMSDSVDREIGQRHRTGSSVRRPSGTRIGLSSPLKPSHRLTLRMNASQKQLSYSVQEHGATMARERLPWESTHDQENNA